jgi:enoyl-CoA hydratase
MRQVFLTSRKAPRGQGRFFTFTDHVGDVMYETIVVNREEAIGVITLSRPDAMNALNTKMVTELIDALNGFEKDESVKCIVVTGNESAFSAGADITEMIDMSAVDMAKTGHFFPLWDKVGRYPKPIVGALSGFVLGGGLELAMSCDVLIASDTARLGQPEINIGVIPGGGGTQRLTRAVGKSKAMEMVLTGRMIGADEAKTLGLVSRVVPKEAFLDEAKRTAREIASKSPLAVKFAKQAVSKAFEMGLSDGLDFERELFYLLFASEDKVEGMKAFLEKKKPEFKGK